MQIARDEKLCDTTDFAAVIPCWQRIITSDFAICMEVSSSLTAFVCFGIIYSDSKMNGILSLKRYIRKTY